MYALVLKLGLGVCLLVTAVLAAVGAVMEGDAASHFGRALLEYPGRALMVFAWTTLSFAAIDYALTRWDVACSWDPRDAAAPAAERELGSRGSIRSWN